MKSSVSQASYIDRLQEPNYRAVIPTSWSGMLAVLLAMLMLSPLQYAMNGQYEALTLVLRDDPSSLGLQVLIVLLCLNAIVQVTVHARSCRTAKVCVLVLSVLYGLFFLAHNIVHMVGGEPLGLQSVLDFTHHVLAGLAIWGAWLWQKAA